jgi:transcriptional regulator with XRE-family HTH domain
VEPERPLAVPKTPRLRELRERAAYSQQELARAAGLSRTTVSHAETGRITPQAATVRKLARVLGVRPAELMAPPPTSGEASAPPSSPSASP